MKLTKQFCLTALAEAMAVMVLVGCGGGAGDAMVSGQQAGSEGVKLAATSATGNTLTVRARADLAGVTGGPADYKQGAFMVIIADGKVIDSTEVRATEFQNYTFTLPSVAAGTKIDVVFNNDENTANGQDRNLFVESITANGQTILPTAPGVTFDRATTDKATAFDGIDVLPGTGALWWNGALRFTLGSGTTVASNLSPACTSFYAAAPGFMFSATRLVDAIVSMAKPAKGAAFAEPNYKTCVTRATDHAADGVAGSGRTEYSRRQMFNADNTRQLIVATDGYYYLYDANTHAVVKKLPSFSGDPEIQWHPTNPNLIYVMPAYGSEAKQKEMNVVTGEMRVLGDFTARLQALFPNAAIGDVNTGAEGSPSADGRFWCYIVREKTKSNQWGSKLGVGVFTWDRDTDTILGSLPLAGEVPDHVSMSPTGNYCVVSSDGSIGTTAYSRDFSQTRKLFGQSVHSDLALDANGDDAYVFIDSYNYGDVYTTNLRTGEKTLLMANVRTDFHFSGKAYKKPGWVVASTLDKWEGPEPAQWMQRKVMALELKANPTVYNLAFHRVNYSSYNTSPVASVNRDFTRIAFNSNWNSSNTEDIDTYNIEIPAGMLVGQGAVAAPATPPTTPPPPATPPTTPPVTPPTPAALSATVGKVTHSGYNASYVLTTNQPALCRATWTAGKRYVEIYDDIPASADGLTHTKSLGLPGTGPQKVYAACKAKASSAETQVTINIQ